VRVFLSSTYADLADYRRCAAEALERLGQQPGRMEVFGARPEEPSEACIREIDQCDLFVGIYAHRYGYVPEGSEVSITELEFQHAKDKSKPIFCFLVDEVYPWPPPMIEAEPGRAKLSRFKDTLQRQLVRETFTTPQDLAVKVATSVGKYTTDEIKKYPRDIAAQQLPQTQGRQSELDLMKFSTLLRPPLIRREPARFHMTSGQRPRRSYFTWSPRKRRNTPMVLKITPYKLLNLEILSMLSLTEFSIASTAVAIFVSLRRSNS
jgi:Domain of unknown function (DUF4062)